MTTVTRLAAVAVSVALVLAFAGCGEGDKNKARQAAASPCPASLGGATAAPVPTDLPTPDGATVFDHLTQGKTGIWQLALPGGPSDLVRLRDAYDDALRAHGYGIDHTDQEPGAEAESEFTGPHDGTTNFRPLCSGRVVLRLKLTS